MKRCSLSLVWLIICLHTITLSGQSAGANPAQTSSSLNAAQQDSAAMAALALGIPPDSHVELNLNAPIDANSNPNPDSVSAPPPGSVPEPTTAILIGSGICFYIISRLRKRQEVFDYYNK
ncbi:MAG: PEP-CTERM sorting domain-containing protein [Acidobacteriaceae bacterium]